ncbi:MAG TPA: phage tail length tape measure family protein [Thermomicrobiales bacterium]|jgi:hypothetical protein
MAGSPVINVVFKAVTDDLKKGFKDASDSGKSFGQNLKGVGKAAVVAGGAGGLALLAVGLKTGIDEMSQAAKVGAQTEAVLKSTGGAAGVSAKQIEGMATALMNKSGMDDEAIQSGENLLLTFTKVQNVAGKGNDIFNQATRTMLDMSVALGQDTKTSAIQLGKALNDPVKGITALQRVGVSFTAAQKEQIATLVKHGDTLKAQKIILAELNREFGGSAEAVGNTLPGQVNKLKESFSNLAGEMVSQLAPAFIAITKFLTEHPAAFKALVIAVFALAAAFVVLNAALAVSAALSAGLLAPIAIVIGIIAALGVGLYLLVRNWSTVKAALITGWNAVRAAVVAAVNGIKSAVTAVFNWIRSNWPLLVAIIAGPLGIALALVIRNWAAIKSATVAAWNAVKGAITAVLGAIRGAISSGFAAIVGVVRRAMTSLVGAIRAGVGAAGAAARAIVAAVKGAFSGAAGWLVSAGRDLVLGFVHGIESMVGAAASAASKVAHGAMNAAKGILGIGSPSKVFYSFGQDTVQGFANGINASIPKAQQAAANMAVAAIRAARGPLSTAATQLGGYLQQAFGASQQAAKTPAEIELANMEAARAEAQRQQALAAAQSQMAAASTDDERLAAQQAYDQATYDIRAAALQKQAEQERAALQGTQYVQQQAFDKALTSLQNYLASSHATAQGARTRINKLMKDFGIDLGTAGTLLGSSFASGLEKSIGQVTAAATKLVAALKKAIKSGLKISSPSRVMRDEVGKQVVAGIAQGITQNSGLVDRALASAIPGIGDGGAATLLQPIVDDRNVEVRVFLGNQELRGMVRTEIVQSNLGVARTLLAGSVAR